MKKRMPILLAVMMLTACGQDTENDREAVYVNIKKFGGILDWTYEVEK